MVHADGSLLQTWEYLRQNGLQGFIDIWPRPTAIAWKIIACYGAFEAALQLLLPGKRVEGPISPAGNRPVYKVLDTWFLCQNCFDKVIRAYEALLLHFWLYRFSKNVQLIVLVVIFSYGITEISINHKLSGFYFSDWSKLLLRVEYFSSICIF